MDTALDATTCANLLLTYATASRPRVPTLCFRYTYFMEQRAPVTGSPALMDYACFLRGELLDGKVRLVLGVDVPVMTVCPCSKAISDEGAQPGEP